MKIQPGKVGLWSEEGATVVHTGDRYIHSVCQNADGPNEEGWLNPAEDSDHECVAEVYGASAAEALENALAVVRALNRAAV